MSIIDSKFTETQFAGADVASLPDNPSEEGMSAEALKNAFDRVGKYMVALGKHNSLVDALGRTAEDDPGAAGIGLFAPGILAKDVNAGMAELQAGIGAVKGDTYRKQETYSRAEIDARNAGKAGKAEVLMKGGTEAFTPRLPYEPATKQYVDTGGGGSVRQDYVDERDTVMLETARDYADTQDAGVLGAAREYAEERGREALFTAKAYTDEKTLPFTGVTSGSAAAYTLAVNSSFALTDGVQVKARLHAANGANPTLNVNGLGAKAICKPDGTRPMAGEFVAGSYAALVYNGTDFFVLGGSAPRLSGTATAADVTRGKTFYSTDAKTKLTGSMSAGALPKYFNQNMTLWWAKGTGLTVACGFEALCVRVITEYGAFLYVNGSTANNSNYEVRFTVYPSYFTCWANLTGLLDKSVPTQIVVYGR